MMPVALGLRGIFTLQSIRGVEGKFDLAVALADELEKW